MNFSDLNLTTPLLNALVDLGFNTPTSIQQKVLPVAMSGRDVVGIAQTGTGKTIAYLLPCLRQIKFSKEKSPQVLILVPTRELVVQVLEELEKLSKYFNIRIGGVYGGVKMARHTALVRDGLDVIVATPGRLLDLVLHGTLKLKAVKKLVIDEVDEMLNLGFRHQLLSIFDLLPEKRQNLMFSATITPEVEQIMDTYFAAPARVEASPTGTPLENIKQESYRVPNFNTKVNLLELLIKENKEMSKVLIFSATKALANQLFEELEKRIPKGFGVIHSNKAQSTRFNTVKQFRSGECKYLIATDIIARGLDVAEVSHVINFDLPSTPENYIHRIGRTGRADKNGEAIAFITSADLKYLKEIESLMKMSIPVKELPENLILSDVLTEDEKPVIIMKTPTTPPVDKDRGAAFHKRSAKNSKIKLEKRYIRERKEKYKKPITRGQKVKGKR